MSRAPTLHAPCSTDQPGSDLSPRPLASSFRLQVLTTTGADHLSVADQPTRNEDAPMPAAPPRSIVPAILASAAIALAINLFRLWGELQEWNPFWFNRAGGGGGSPLGISWLVIPVGFWFGRRLAAAGNRPESVARAILMPVLGIALMFGVFALSMKVTDDWRTRAIVINTGALACGLLALVAWKRAYFVNLSAGILARIPVAIIQFVAVDRAWDVHFAKGPPEAPEADVPFMLTLAQCVMWPFGFTVLVGGLFAAIGAATVRR